MSKLGRGTWQFLLRTCIHGFTMSKLGRGTWQFLLRTCIHGFTMSKLGRGTWQFLLKICIHGFTMGKLGRHQVLGSSASGNFFSPLTMYHNTHCPLPPYNVLYTNFPLPSYNALPPPSPYCTGHFTVHLFRVEIANCPLDLTGDRAALWRESTWQAADVHIEHICTVERNVLCTAHMCTCAAEWREMWSN